VSIQGQSENLPSSGNSLEGIRRAFRDGVRAVEVDFRLAADGKLVASHNAELSGTCGTVAGSTSVELRGCRLARGYRIATLDQLLTIPFEEIYLDLKDTAHVSGARAVDQALRDVGKAKRLGDVVLMVYDASPEIVSSIHDAGARGGLKGYPTSVEETLRMNRVAQAARLELVCVNLPYVSERVIEDAARRGVWHLAWKGEPDIASLRQLASKGLGGLITKQYGRVHSAIRP
jgi:glycerophosphoryl diester phosphodiesterase